MTREKLKTKIDEYAHDKDSGYMYSTHLESVDVRNFIWSLMEQHAKDRADELDVNTVLPMPPTSKHIVTVDITSVKKRSLDIQ